MNTKLFSALVVLLLGTVIGGCSTVIYKVGGKGQYIKGYEDCRKEDLKLINKQMAVINSVDSIIQQQRAEISVLRTEITNYEMKRVGERMLKSAQQKEQYRRANSGRN